MDLKNTQHVEVCIDEDIGKISEKERTARRLELAWWLAAYDRCTLAAVITDQFSFHAAQLHKKNVLEIAAGVSAEDRKPLLAVMYDEIMRQELDEKSNRLR
eukprot:12362715-Karenia_brevis.AAC.1